MASTINLLRLLADPTRLRLLLLLEQEELSVAELQQILGMGQSRISSHLAQLKRAGVVADRRVGKNVYYGANHNGQNAQREIAVRLEVSAVRDVERLSVDRPEHAAPRIAACTSSRLRERTPVTQNDVPRSGPLVTTSAASPIVIESTAPFDAA